MKKHWDRRRFLGTVGGAMGGLLILANSRSAFSYQANEKLNIAAVGIGGMGAWNLAHIAGENVEFGGGMRIIPASQPAKTGENIVALCDVDERTAADSAAGRRNPPGETFARYPGAKRYRDYRRMLDEMDGAIDSVVVSTPDHLHSPISLAAMQRGKHVYLEKPGAHSVAEARRLAEVATQQRVVTQLGTQMHASDNYRRIVELIRSGAIGPVREVHIWQRGGGSGARGRPAERPPVPEGLDWDLFLGPTRYRPYHPTYSRGCGGNWQAWWDFGLGALGNIAPHYFDLAFWALDLRYPVRVEAEGPPPHPETTPGRLHLRYQFSARGEMPPLALTWTQGSEPPPIFAENALPGWVWGVFVGTEGMLLVDYERRMLWPEKKFADFVAPEPTLPPPIGADLGRHPQWIAAYRALPAWRRDAEVAHRAEWIAACKTGNRPSCHFGYSGPLIEAVMLGAVAHRAGTALDWDPANLRVTNAAEAIALLKRDYRSGWSF